MKKIIVTENQFKKIVKKISKSKDNENRVFANSSIDGMKKNNLSETTRRQKAIQAIKGISKNIKTCAILTAFNPMVRNLPKEYNDRLNEKLKAYLKTGNFVWFPVKGEYDGKENSFIIYNISLEDTLHIGEKFEQESVIWIDNRSNDITYQYWEQNGNGIFKKIHERKHYLDMTDADDFFTQISRKFRFQIPFFDGKDNLNESILFTHNNILEKIININIEKNDYDKKWVEERISHLTDNTLSGKGLYESRGNIYGGYENIK